ncbi:hypothetical protein BUALT_Bualt04G0063100 [Buddleja alternifolia]|uniref:Methyltransferase type 11 domain-containing protein n=1 Tax=Buddleja alternifolia TaxID=168488 RepID=A0AAV6XLT3_9LAMI|nr:hypothetical protein BUALT_Bualt04G0063100 [Buddleja alternifolia]
MPHPRIRYLHTPLSLSDDELINLIGTENSVDLITVAQAIHWFDLPRFYSIVTRLLKKPGGILVVWGYSDITVSPTFDAAGKRWFETTLPYWSSKTQSLYEGYKELPFPFESVGLRSEGSPLALDIPKKLSFEGYLRMIRSWSAIVTAKENGVDLLSKRWLRSWRMLGVVLICVYTLPDDMNVSNFKGTPSQGEARNYFKGLFLEE